MLWGTLAISIVAIVSDIFLKQAANSKNWGLLAVASVMYGLGALLWYHVYKTAKFSTVGVVYSLFTIILSLIIGLTFFKESLGLKEILGIVIGVVAIVLLS